MAGCITGSGLDRDRQREPPRTSEIFLAYSTSIMRLLVACSRERCSVSRACRSRSAASSRRSCRLSFSALSALYAAGRVSHQARVPHAHTDRPTDRTSLAAGRTLPLTSASRLASSVRSMLIATREVALSGGSSLIYDGNATSAQVVQRPPPPPPTHLRRPRRSRPQTTLPPRRPRQLAPSPPPPGSPPASATATRPERLARLPALGRGRRRARRRPPAAAAPRADCGSRSPAPPCAAS